MSKTKLKISPSKSIALSSKFQSKKCSYFEILFVFSSLWNSVWCTGSFRLKQLIGSRLNRGGRLYLASSPIVILCFTTLGCADGLFLLSHVSVSFEQIIAERNHLLTLISHRLSVAVVWDFDHCGCGRRGQERFLELNLLQKQLVCLEWR